MNVWPYWAACLLPCFFQQHLACCIRVTCISSESGGPCGHLEDRYAAERHTLSFLLVSSLYGVQIVLAWLMAYAVAAIVKKDGKPYVDMAAVRAAPSGTFFWVTVLTLQ